MYFPYVLHSFVMILLLSNLELNCSQINFLIFSCWVCEILERSSLLYNIKNVHFYWGLVLM